MGKRRKKSALAKKTKSASEASREVVWKGERVAGAARLSLIAVFFLFDSGFCLFPPLRSLVPGYFLSEKQCMPLGINSSNV